MSSNALRFTQIGDTGKTLIWQVWAASGVLLGKVSWYSQWRRYVFWPEDTTLFDMDCLNQIASFLRGQMAVRKAKGILSE